MTWPIVVGLLVLVSATIVRTQAAKVDVSGKWVLEMEVAAAAASNPTVVLKQTDEKLTGQYSSGAVTSAEITGTVKGQTVTFGFSTQGIDITFTGTLESKDSMKGTVSLGPAGEGTFTGKRQ